MKNILIGNAVHKKGRFTGRIRFMLTVHVDDILITAKDEGLIQDFKNEFNLHVTELKQFQNFRKYLGLKIEINAGIIYLNQKDYAEYIIKRFVVTESK